ncbi:MAG: hypothetical protein R3C60_09935 [Parvularculaceae bacterium]
MDDFKSPLGVLAAVQTALVVLLFFKLSHVEGELADMRFAAAHADEISQPAPAGVAAYGGAEISRSEVREIIRDELLPVKAALSNLGRDGGAAAAAVSAPPRTAETDRIYDDFKQEMRRLVAQGTASEAEMAALQAKVAKLPQSQRNAALLEMSKAMSNGSLDATF